MSDDVWKGLAMLRLAAECEMLRAEIAALRQEVEKAKGLREVKEDAD